MVMTPAMVQQVYQALDSTSTLASEQIMALESFTSGLGRAEWAKVVSETAPEILLSWRNVSVDIMAGALDSGTSLGVSSTALADSRLLTQPRVAALAGWTAEHTSSPDSALRKLAGIGVKLVLEGPRRYSSALSAEYDMMPRTYAQPNACEWCRYIVVQEYRYGHYGSEWVKTNSADRFHEHCRCVLIPDAEFIEPDYLSAWNDQVEAASEKAGTGYGKNTWRDHLAAMRELN